MDELSVLKAEFAECVAKALSSMEGRLSQKIETSMENAKEYSG